VDTPDEAFIRSAIDQSNLNALRLALYQQTGDPELAAMRVEPRAIRGGSMFAPSVAHADRPLLKEKALAYFLAGGAAPAPRPDRDEAVRLLELFGVAFERASEADLALEELAFEESPREVTWDGAPPPPEVLARYRVTVIGAGMSGLATGIRLKSLGIPFEIIERQDGVGGTWRLNDYPEARVDVSNFLYQFKFEKNYPWKSFFAGQAEIRAYLDHIADKYGLRPHIRLNTAVEAAVWDEADQEWRLTLRDRDGAERLVRSPIVISAAGLFSTANIPDIPGLGTFEGEVFHTTAWNHGYDHTGKRVALIGTGSSGAQLMPRLARESGSLTVFQRTPNWILPAEGYRAPVSPEQRWLLDNLPYYWNWFCYAVFILDLQLQPLQEHDPAWLAAHGEVSERSGRLRAHLEDFIRKKIGHRPDLMDQCMPDYPPAARRLVVDNGWFEALLQSNVELVSTPIEAITHAGVVTRDGTERAFDLIVLGSGFKTSHYLWPARYQGRGGITPQALWAKDGARSYLGMTMPGFPNFFMFYGPNGQGRAGSFNGWSEMWARYALKVVMAMIRRGARSVEVREPVFAAYNARLDEAMAGMIWGAPGAGSYYLNEHGRSGVNMPWSIEDFHAWTVEPDLDDFQFN